MATSASPGLSDHSRAMLIGAAGLAIILLGVGSALLPAADRLKARRSSAACCSSPG